eukprot:UN34484
MILTNKEQYYTDPNVVDDTTFLIQVNETDGKRYSKGGRLDHKIITQNDISRLNRYLRDDYEPYFPADTSIKWREDRQELTCNDIEKLLYMI